MPPSAARPRRDPDARSLSPLDAFRQHAHRTDDVPAQSHLSALVHGLLHIEAALCDRFDPDSFRKAFIGRLGDVIRKECKIMLRDSNRFCVSLRLSCPSCRQVPSRFARLNANPAEMCVP
eukprot:6207669-Pleurochrysis_carterae.AAC.1